MEAEVGVVRPGPGWGDGGAAGGGGRPPVRPGGGSGRTGRPVGVRRAARGPRHPTHPADQLPVRRGRHPADHVRRREPHRRAALGDRAGDARRHRRRRGRPLLRARRRRPARGRARAGGRHRQRLGRAGRLDADHAVRAQRAQDRPRRQRFAARGRDRRHRHPQAPGGAVRRGAGAQADQGRDPRPVPQHRLLRRRRLRCRRRGPHVLLHDTGPAHPGAGDAAGGPRPGAGPGRPDRRRPVGGAGPAGVRPGRDGASRHDDGRGRRPGDRRAGGAQAEPVAGRLHRGREHGRPVLLRLPGLVVATAAGVRGHAAPGD